MIMRGGRQQVINSFQKNRIAAMRVPLRLDQNVNHGTLLIDSLPPIMLYFVDLQEDFVQKPFVAQLGSSPLQFGSAGCAEGFAPTPDLALSSNGFLYKPSPIPLRGDFTE